MRAYDYTALDAALVATVARFNGVRFKAIDAEGSRVRELSAAAAAELGVNREKLVDRRLQHLRKTRVLDTTRGGHWTVTPKLARSSEESAS